MRQLDAWLQVVDGESGRGNNELARLGDLQSSLGRIRRAVQDD